MLNQIDRTPPSSGVRSFFKKPVLIILLIFVLCGVVWYGTQDVLTILPEKGEPIVLQTHPGEEWRYHYKHSVQLTPCDEYFRINGPHDMTMTHTIYESFGVGLPYDASEGEFISLKEQGKFEMIMNRPYQSVTFRTAVQAMPNITYHGQTYDLCSLYGQGTKVEVTVMKRYEFWML
jgi:hypothetical protein